jgi:hypothetical protein
MSIAKKSIAEKTITFSWADETVTSVDTSLFNAEVQEHARLHGFSQKLGDSYSGAKDIAEAKERLDATFQALTEGDWNRKGIATGGLWVAAIAKAVGKSLEETLEKWNAMDEDTRKAVCKHPDVILARKEIELARAQAKAKGADDLVI